MYKSLLLIIFSYFLISSCSFKNPLSNKSQIAYVDCPKTLILAPASKIIKEEMTLNLNKNYTMSCYFLNQNPTQVIFEFNYVIDISKRETNSLEDDFKFIFFATNKSENEKLHEKIYDKSIRIEETNLDNTNSIIKQQNNDQIIIEKSIFDRGIKLFIGII
jgi:hypothetical protein